MNLNRRKESTVDPKPGSSMEQDGLDMLKVDKPTNRREAPAKVITRDWIKALII